MHSFFFQKSDLGITKNRGITHTSIAANIYYTMLLRRIHVISRKSRVFSIRIRRLKILKI